MNDGDGQEAIQWRRQLDELANEVRAARREARLAIAHAEVARWCGLQLAHVVLDLMAKRDVITRAEIGDHLESTLALMRPHLAQKGMRELAKEIDVLLVKFACDRQPAGACHVAVRAN